MLGSYLVYFAIQLHDIEIRFRKNLLIFSPLRSIEMMCKCQVYVLFGWQKRRMYYACLFPSNIVYENNPQAVQIILTHVAKCEGSKLILKSFTNFDG